MNVLDHLVEEHRSVEAMLRTLASTEPGHVRDKTLEALVKALTTHMALEERYVYPIVQAAVGAEEETGAENEHELTRAGLDKMRELASEPGFVAAVEMVQTGISHHVEEEENTIFPRLRKKAAKEIEALGDAAELEESVKSGALDDQTKEELYKQAQEAGIEGRSSMTKAELQDALAHH
jgi:iron-sulfur cluster repair protein YtfE (RIC family)